MLNTVNLYDRHCTLLNTGHILHQDLGQLLVENLFTLMCNDELQNLGTSKILRSKGFPKDTGKDVNNVLFLCHCRVTSGTFRKNNE